MPTLRSYFHKHILMAICTMLGGIAMIGLLSQLVLALGDGRLSGLETTDFLIYMLLKLPQIIAVIMPFGVYVGTLVAMNSARAANEITSSHASGVSFWAMAGIGMPPAIIIAIAQGALYSHIVPFSRIASAGLVQANALKALSGVISGVFVTPIPGLTLRYDQISGNTYSGVFANFNDGSTDTTYVAQKALLSDKTDDLSLIMYDGAIISFGGKDASGVLSFDQYTLNLSGLIEDTQTFGRQTDSLYIHELFASSENKQNPEQTDELRSEGHFRMSIPLLTPFLALLAGLAVVGGRVSRSHYPLRIAFFCLIAVIVVVAPYVTAELVRRFPGWMWTYYAQPALLAACLVCTHLNASSNKPRS